MMIKGLFVHGALPGSLLSSSPAAASLREAAGQVSVAHSPERQFLVATVHDPH